MRLKKSRNLCGTSIDIQVFCFKSPWNMSIKVYVVYGSVGKWAVPLSQDESTDYHHHLIFKKKSSTASRFGSPSPASRGLGTSHVEMDSLHTQTPLGRCLTAEI